MSNFLTSDVGRSLYAPAAVMAAAAISAAVTWAKDLSADARRLRLLEQESKRLDFWDKYLKTLDSTDKETPEETRIATNEIRHATAVVRNAFAFRSEFTPATLEAIRRSKVPDWRWTFMFVRIEDPVLIFHQVLAWVGFALIALEPPIYGYIHRSGRAVETREYFSYALDFALAIIFWFYFRAYFRREFNKELEVHLANSGTPEEDEDEATELNVGLVIDKR